MGQTPGTLARTVRNAKRNGELVEIAFLHKAVSLGFAAAKPYGDSELYDFILDATRCGASRLWRVQVKSSGCNFHGAYHITAGHFSSRPTKVGYAPEQIDFLVAYIVPEDAWYIIPASVVVRLKSSLRLYPHCTNQRKHKYECYFEAWHLLKSAKPKAKSATSSGH